MYRLYSKELYINLHHYLPLHDIKGTLRNRKYDLSNNIFYHV